MAVLVIDDAGVVRGVVAIPRSGGVEERAVLEHVASRAEVDLALGRDRIELAHAVPVARQAIVPALEGRPALLDPLAVPRSVAHHRSVMSVDPRDHRRER